MVGRRGEHPLLVVASTFGGRWLIEDLVEVYMS